MPSGHVKYSAAAECDDYSFQLGKRSMKGNDSQAWGMGWKQWNISKQWIALKCEIRLRRVKYWSQAFNVKYPTYVGCDDYSFRLGSNLKGKDPQAWETGAQQWNIQLRRMWYMVLGYREDWLCHRIALLSSESCFVWRWNIKRQVFNVIYDFPDTGMISCICVWPVIWGYEKC